MKLAKWDDLVDPLDDVDFNAVELTEEDLFDFEPDQGPLTLEEHLQMERWAEEGMKNINKLIAKSKSYDEYCSAREVAGLPVEYDRTEWFTMENPPDGIQD